jgi:hypothetical protein
MTQSGSFTTTIRTEWSLGRIAATILQPVFPDTVQRMDCTQFV